MGGLAGYGLKKSSLQLGLGLRRSRVIGDSFSELRYFEVRKKHLGIDLLAHDMDVCVVLEFSQFYIIHVCLDVLLGPLRPMSRKVRNRVIGDSLMYDAYQGL